MDKKEIGIKDVDFAEFHQAECGHPGLWKLQNISYKVKYYEAKSILTMLFTFKEIW